MKLIGMLVACFGLLAMSPAVAQEIPPVAEDAAAAVEQAGEAVATVAGYDLYTVSAIVAVCVVIIVKSVFEWRGGKVNEQFKRYYPYAMMAFSWVEKTVPDDYGANEGDPTLARAAHKLDLFCQKFIEVSARFEGSQPNEKMMGEAKRLAAALAEKRTAA